MEGSKYISNYAVLANSDCGEMPEKKPPSLGSDKRGSFFPVLLAS